MLVSRLLLLLLYTAETKRDQEQNPEERQVLQRQFLILHLRHCPITKEIPYPVQQPNTDPISIKFQQKQMVTQCQMLSQSN